MGHVAEKGIGINDTPFNIFYSSFHMPLFMFLSGIFAYKSFKKCDVAEFVTFLKKKTLRLILPLLTIGGGYSLLLMSQKEVGFLDAISGYWFLPALFYCMILGAITNFFKLKFAKNRIGLELAIETVAWLLAMTVYYSKMADGIPFYLHFVKMYPFFILGVFFNSHESVKKSLLERDSVLAVSIVCFVCSFLIKELPIKISGFFAIAILMHTFVKYDKQIPRLLTIVGRYSLEIYVFHWFMLPQLSNCRDFFTNQTGFLLDNGNFTLLFVLCLFVALCIVALCMVLAKTIRSCKTLSYVLFGG